MFVFYNQAVAVATIIVNTTVDRSVSQFIKQVPLDQMV